MDQLSEYSHDMKKRLANRISKLKKKEDIIKIYEIISRENTDFTENSSGLFLYFHKLSNKTYYEIEKYLAFIKKNENLISTDSASTEKKEYVPYYQDDFSSQKIISPKLKFSNKEKNIIKRRRFEDIINNESSSDLVNSEKEIKKV